MKQNKTIDSFSTPYAILKNYICFSLKRIFYRKVTVLFDDVIPENTPLIFASNHQNALMDPLQIICSNKRQIVFFARADIFKNKRVSKILRFLKIAPIYRIRDGASSLQENYKVFNTAGEILSRNNSFAMFPEASHNDMEQLLPFKKGMARIALQAEAENDFKLNLHIVPIGIAYSDYIKTRSEVIVHYGKPFKIDDLKTLYEESQSQAYQVFNERLENAIKKNIIHIENRDEKTVIQTIRTIIENDSFQPNTSFPKKFEQLKNHISVIQQYPEFMQKISPQCAEYQQKLNDNSLQDFLFSKNKTGWMSNIAQMLFLLLYSPFYLLGYFVLFLPAELPKLFIRKKIKDPQFRSSVFFVLVFLITLPLFIIIYTVLALSFINTCLIFILLFSLLMSGIIYFPYRKLFSWYLQKIRFLFIKKSKSKLIKNLSELRQEIVFSLEHFF